MSKLLLDEYPLIILPQLAKVVGLNEAIVLQQIHYWLELYKQSKSLRHYKDGRWWVYNSVRQWQSNFPFWSPATISRILKSLRQPYPPEDEELKKNDPRIQRDPLLLATREYNKMAYDKTLWYTICYDEVRRIEETLSQNETPLSQNETPLSQNETPLFHSASMDSSNLIEPIPETTHETTQETTAAAAETQREKSSTNNGDFAQALRAYQDSFGPLGSSFKYEKFQMLWDEHPVSEIHEYARKEMCRAMMDDSRRVHPNLAYYAQCLATGAARAEGKRSERRGDGKRRNVPKRTVVDFDDPAVKAWMAERSKNGRHD